MSSKYCSKRIKTCTSYIRPGPELAHLKKSPTPRQILLKMRLMVYFLLIFAILAHIRQHLGNICWLNVDPMLIFKFSKKYRYFFIFVSCSYGDFFNGGGGVKNCYIFPYTCPNGSGVGAIDRCYRAEHVFDPYWTLEVLRNFFMILVWTIRLEKMAKNGLFGIL